MFFPLILFHSNPKEAKNADDPVTIAIINTSRTAELYASRTNGNCASETIFLMPVAPAMMMVLGSMLGILFPISLTRPFDSTEFEIARNTAPLPKLAIVQVEGPDWGKGGSGEATIKFART